MDEKTKQLKKEYEFTKKKRKAARTENCLKKRKLNPNKLKLSWSKIFSFATESEKILLIDTFLNDFIEFKKTRYTWWATYVKGYFNFIENNNRKREYALYYYSTFCLWLSNYMKDKPEKQKYIQDHVLPHCIKRIQNYKIQNFSNDNQKHISAIQGATQYQFQKLPVLPGLLIDNIFTDGIQISGYDYYYYGLCYLYQSTMYFFHRRQWSFDTVIDLPVMIFIPVEFCEFLKYVTGLPNSIYHLIHEYFLEMPTESQFLYHLKFNLQVKEERVSKKVPNYMKEQQYHTVSQGISKYVDLYYWNMHR